jgi:hypothetical protein
LFNLEEFFRHPGEMVAFGAPVKHSFGFHGAKISLGRGFPLLKQKRQMGDVHL